MSRGRTRLRSPRRQRASIPCSAAEVPGLSGRLAPPPVWADAPPVGVPPIHRARVDRVLGWLGRWERFHPLLPIGRRMHTPSLRRAATVALLLVAAGTLSVAPNGAYADATATTVTVNARAGLATVPQTALGINDAIWDSQLGTTAVS